MKMRFAIGAWAAFWAVALVPYAHAQRGFAGSMRLGGGQRGSGGGFHAHGPFRGGGRGHFARPRFRGRRGYYSPNRSRFIAAPYFYPLGFYGDYNSSESRETEASVPQVVVVKTAEPVVESPPPPPVEPLMLERRGDHWVRITDSGESEVGVQEGPAQGSSPRSATAEGDMLARRVPAAVLVFRDGHQEKTRKYTIIGPVIYTSTNYWAGGAWTKKIPLAELDVPATLRVNQERGVKFNLPSAPNEVVVRP
ncbi:MAG TPA: hypothetical protein VMW54_01950 [Terriglobia bacterium]|nr:hypothetical protein [Terriglobia bacterium]